MTINGTPGNNHLNGTTGNDDFDVSQGGNDTIRAKAGDDFIRFGAEYTSHDVVDGGAGVDAIVLNGFYANAIFGANITSIEQISLISDLNYTVTMRDSAVAAGRLMNFDGSELDTGNHFTLNASAETDGRYFVSGSGGADVIKTGSGADEVFGGGGNDTIYGGAGADLIGAGLGNDTIYGGDDIDTILFDGNGAFDSSDRVYGGDDIWSDTLELDGDYSGGLAITKAMVHLDTIRFDGGHDYVVTVKVAGSSAGGPYIFDSSDLDAGDTFSLDAHANGPISFRGGDGTDAVAGGRGYNDYTGGGGADVLTGNKSNDVFFYNAVSDSRGTQYDTVVNFDTRDDFFDPHFGGISEVPDSFGGRVTHGRLGAANFNHDLAHNVGAGELGADGAVLYRAQHGDLAGQWFLIIDGNSTAGYQSNHDLVVLLQDSVAISGFDLTNFGTAG